MRPLIVARNRVTLSPKARSHNLALSRCAILLLILCHLTSCVLLEEDTRVSIDGNVPPTFKLDGSGHQMSFAVREIAPDNRVEAPYQKPNARVWEIVPNQGTSDEVWLWPKITYGKVPPGFAQTFPTDGTAPTLIEGNVYSAGGEAYNANGGEIWFTITDGKSLEVPKPGGH